MAESRKILIIQTAFIGDVVLATPLIEQLKIHDPNIQIDFLLRKGNEGLFKGHPHLRKVLVLDKKSKYKDLWRILRMIRKEAYTEVINVQRFLVTGLLTAFSGAKETTGFGKNPMAFLFSRRIAHEISVRSATHEVDRNLKLIEHITGEVSVRRPRLYPSKADYETTKRQGKYVCIAPASVWFTKQLPREKWIELIRLIPVDFQMLLIGGPGDRTLCEAIKQASEKERVEVLAGKLSYLQSVALIERAAMTWTNDSAPLHFASAVNAPVTAVFCSTVPAFGFGPLSDRGWVVETGEYLKCKPCGLHGRKACPEGHFKCAEIATATLLKSLGTKS